MTWFRLDASGRRINKCADIVSAVFKAISTLKRQKPSRRVPWIFAYQPKKQKYRAFTVIVNVPFTALAVTEPRSGEKLLDFAISENNRMCPLECATVGYLSYSDAVDLMVSLLLASLNDVFLLLSAEESNDQLPQILPSLRAAFQANRVLSGLPYGESDGLLVALDFNPVAYGYRN